MAKCFLTGLEVTMDEACVLDGGVARRALRDLRLRLAAVDRFAEQLPEPVGGWCSRSVTPTGTLAAQARRLGEVFGGKEVYRAFRMRW